MGLRQITATLLKTVRDVLDLEQELGSEMLAKQYVELRQQVTILRKSLSETRRALKERDELVEKLQAAGVIRENLVMDGSAYFVRKNGRIEDGPFCTCCFDQNQQMVRLVPTPKPVGGAGRSSEWVQCLKCRIPFRSGRAGEYLNGPKSAPARTVVSKERRKKSKPRKASKRRSLARSRLQTT